MEIYAIRRDGYDFQELDLEVDDFIEYMPEDLSYNAIHDFSLENLPLLPYWKPVRTGFSKISGKENRIPDVCNWIGATLVLSPKAHRLLHDLLSPFGEFLPVLVEKDTFYIFNCLTQVMSILNNSEPVFNEYDVNGKVVFKTPEQHCIDIYCTERLKNAIQEFELSGVVFDKNNDHK